MNGFVLNQLQAALIPEHVQVAEQLGIVIRKLRNRYEWPILHQLAKYFDAYLQDETVKLHAGVFQCEGYDDRHVQISLAYNDELTGELISYARVCVTNRLIGLLIQNPGGHYIDMHWSHADPSDLYVSTDRLYCTNHWGDLHGRRERVADIMTLMEVGAVRSLRSLEPNPCE